MLKITKPMGERAQKIAHESAAADLGGDAKFSGWKPPLDTHLKFKAGATIMLPTRSGAGPWTVAERGRNQGNAGGFSGPGIGKSGQTSRNKSGALRKVRAFKSKRWNGTTKGKQTASKAVARIEKEVLPIAQHGIRKALVRHFDVD